MAEAPEIPKPASMEPHRHVLQRAARSWILQACVIGVIAGAAAVVFGQLLHGLTHYTLHDWMGLMPPREPGWIAKHPDEPVVAATLVIVFLPALGALASGLICHGFAPEAMGSGTDGAIRSFHRAGGKVPFYLPFVKMVTTLLTLCSGGSGGAEGPIAQIGSGVGSNLGQWLEMSERRTRILMAAGMAAGIAALFEAPLAAMIFAGEILYGGADIDGEVLVPSAMACVVSYSVYVGLTSWISGAVRWAHMFEVPAWTFQSGFELIGYTVLAIACGLMARVWIRAFYGIQGAFDGLDIPRWSKPALGGLLTGLLAWLVLGGPGGGLAPAVLGGGYGYLQLALEAKLPLLFMVQLFVLRMVATGFSIGSGGSGGVFGPSLVLGGLLGSAVGLGLEQLHPSLVADPGAYALVGMAALFGAASHTPICSMIMVSEITSSYGLLVPSIWVCTLAFMLVGRESLYRQQVLHIEDSPAHQREMRWNVLADLAAGDWMTRDVVTFHEADSLETIHRALMKHRAHDKFPVLDDERRVVGLLSVHKVREFLRDPEIHEVAIARDAMDPNSFTMRPDATLQDVQDKLDEQGWNLMCVTEGTEKDRLRGILTRRDILVAYNHEMIRRKDAWEEL